MKKIFTLLILGLITLSSGGQNFSSSRFYRIDKMRYNIFTPPGSLKYKQDEVKIPRPSLTNSGNRLNNYLSTMQRMDSHVYQVYDVLNSQWVNSTIDQFSYDANGNNTSDIYSVWSATRGDYDMDSKQEFSYDANGYLTQELYYSWDATYATWVYSIKWVYTYDIQGNMTLGYTYLWDETSSTWTLTGKVDRTYNAYGNMLEEIYSYWNPDASEWITGSKTENVYNAGVYLNTSTSYTWDFIYNVWVNSSMDEYTYNVSNLLIQEMSYIWNSGSNMWIDDYKYAYTYDGYMNMTLSLGSEWNGSVWVTTEKDELAYDNNYTYSQLLLPWYYQGTIVPFQHMLTGITEYDGNPLVLASRSIFNYSDVELTGIPEVQADRVKVFPQPASGKLTFSLGNTSQMFDLKLYDINQRLVLYQTVGNNEVVPVGQLARGLYFYKLRGSHTGALFTGKLSLE
jgi:hypothetical protein